MYDYETWLCLDIMSKDIFLENFAKPSSKIQR